MKPTWKEYDSEAWDHGVAGGSPQPGRPTDRFVFNDCGICINPHVLGVAAKSWRIGIYTAKDRRGRWVAGADFSFQNAGFGSGCLEGDVNFSTPEEKDARILMLRKAHLCVERWSNPGQSCPIPGDQAREALRLISEKIAELSAPKQPIFTQLSLFD